MRTLPLVLAAVLTVPAAAFAEEPAGVEPQWSLGAGVSSGSFVLLGQSAIALARPNLGTYYSYSYLSTVPAASVAASVERSLAPRTWLAFGIIGSYEHDAYDTVPTSTPVVPTAVLRLRKLNVSTASLSVGVRRVVTPVQAPVDVSWVLTADGAWSRSDATVGVDGGADVSQRYTDTIAGATLGVAVDRALGAGLSVRVATPLLRGAWTHQTFRDDFSTPTVDSKGTQVGFGVLLAPRLELRLAF